MVEISSREELETWLEGKPIEWSQALATRMSLRILPLIVAGFQKGKPLSEDQLKLILSSFRTISISWAARRYPAHDMDRASHTAAVAYATIATNAAHMTTYATIYATAAHTTATSQAIAGIAAHNATVTADAIAAKAAYDTYATIAYAAHAIAAYTTSTANANYDTTTAYAAIWVLINADCELLSGYNSPNSAALNLVKEDLWVAGPEIPSSPKWFSEALTSLIKAIHENDHNWHVWIDWYRPLLRGLPCWGLRSENAEWLIVRIAKQDETFWEQGAKAANAQIAKWLADLKRDETEQRRAIKEEANNLRQAIADTKFSHGRMGHNEPPEGFELSAEQTNQVEQAVDAIDTEMDRAEPSVEALTHSAEVLKTALLWAAKKADLAVDAFVAQLGKSAAKAAVGVTALYIVWQKVYEGIFSVLETTAHWLGTGILPI